MKKALFLLALIVCASCHKKTFEERVEADVADFNKNEAPKRMDPATTLDSLAFNKETRTLTHYYTLEGAADDENVLTPTVIELQRGNLLDNIKTNIQLKEHKAHNVTFVYIYKSKKSGKEMLREVFTPKDYNAPSRTYNDKVALEVRQYTESQLPSRIDSTLTMDSITYSKTTRTIITNFTIEGFADNDSLYTQEILDAQKQEQLKIIKENKELKPYKTQGLNFEYRYYSKKTGKVLIDEMFTPKEYK